MIKLVRYNIYGLASFFVIILALATMINTENPGFFLGSRIMLVILLSTGITLCYWFLKTVAEKKRKKGLGLARLKFEIVFKKLFLPRVKKIDPCADFCFAENGVYFSPSSLDSFFQDFHNEPSTFFYLKEEIFSYSLDGLFKLERILDIIEKDPERT